MVYLRSRHSYYFYAGASNITSHTGNAGGDCRSCMRMGRATGTRRLFIIASNIEQLVHQLISGEGVEECYEASNKCVDVVSGGNDDTCMALPSRKHVLM